MAFPLFSSYSGNSQSQIGNNLFETYTAQIKEQLNGLRPESSEEFDKIKAVLNLFLEASKSNPDAQIVLSETTSNLLEKKLTILNQIAGQAKQLANGEEREKGKQFLLNEIAKKIVEIEQLSHEERNRLAESYRKENFETTVKKQLDDFKPLTISDFDDLKASLKTFLNPQSFQPNGNKKQSASLKKMMMAIQTLNETANSRSNPQEKKDYHAFLRKEIEKKIGEFDQLKDADKEHLVANYRNTFFENENKNVNESSVNVTEEEQLKAKSETNDLRTNLIINSLSINHSQTQDQFFVLRQKRELVRKKVEEVNLFLKNLGILKKGDYPGLNDEEFQKLLSDRTELRNLTNRLTNSTIIPPRMNELMQEMNALTQKGAQSLE